MSDRSSRSSGLFDKLFQKRTSVIEIGEPKNMRQIVHVSRDPKTGQLQGVPAAWLRLMDKTKKKEDISDDTEAEQKIKDVKTLNVSQTNDVVNQRE
ncbi:unnamed protein product [Chrysodeixis includens]|uniref:CRIB domain-containing protein n=1 Tax=Chrysodeixis includens TaxID=689277 RepID=A0A9P0E4J7_CHRIL|nr:unnamed protein product [Chrysodeixis includens]